MSCLSAPAPIAIATSVDQSKISMMKEGRKNNYRLLKKLGCGIQGRVMLSLDQQEHRYVAIKLPSAFSGLPENHDVRLLKYQIQSILQERYIYRLVNHPNVLKLVPVKNYDQHYVGIVTEFAENGDLFDLIANSGAFTEQMAKFYFYQLISGIDACHRMGVVHRDIKPENLLLDGQFTLKICDFGLATVCTNLHASEVKLCGVSGTSLYMAPEISETQAYSGAPVDLWSAGVVLFIMLTSFPPFQHACKSDYWYDCVVQGRHDLFWKTLSFLSLSEDAKKIISRLLCADPNQRITIQEILSHPWLNDVYSINQAEVYHEMLTRRQRVLCLKKNA
jgi:serine/threonine protein kinase